MKITTLSLFSATIFAADPGAFHGLYWYAIGLVAAAAIFFGGNYLGYRSSEEQVLPLEIHDGGSEFVRGAIPKGFPRESFIWSGDPCEIALADKRSCFCEGALSTRMARCLASTNEVEL